VSTYSLAYLRPILEPLGFTGAVLIQAGDAHEWAGLGTLADRVRLGLIPPTQPEVVADRAADAGYPPVRVAVAIDPADALLLARGDLVTARDVVDALVDAADDFLERVRRDAFEQAGRVPEL